MALSARQEILDPLPLVVSQSIAPHDQPLTKPITSESLKLLKGKPTTDDTTYSATGAEMWSPYFLALLAEALGWAGQAAASLGTLARALDRVGEMGGRWIEAELHRLRGELLVLAASDHGEAEACFHRGLAIARVQGARMWELRASMSLARLWRDQGKQEEAHALLAPIYSR